MVKKLIAVLALVVGAMTAVVGVDSSLTPAEAHEVCIPGPTNGWNCPAGVDACGQSMTDNGDDPQYNWKMCGPADTPQASPAPGGRG